jgi:hypothetical protein
VSNFLRNNHLQVDLTESRPLKASPVVLEHDLGSGTPSAPEHKLAAEEYFHARSMVSPNHNQNKDDASPLHSQHHETRMELQTAQAAIASSRIHHGERESMSEPIRSPPPVVQQARIDGEHSTNRSPSEQFSILLPRAGGESAQKRVGRQAQIQDEEHVHDALPVQRAPSLLPRAGGESAQKRGCQQAQIQDEEHVHDALPVQRAPSRPALRSTPPPPGVGKLEKPTSTPIDSLQHEVFQKAVNSALHEVDLELKNLLKRVLPATFPAQESPSFALPLHLNHHETRLQLQTAQAVIASSRIHHGERESMSEPIRSPPPVVQQARIDGEHSTRYPQSAKKEASQSDSNPQSKAPRVFGYTEYTKRYPFPANMGYDPYSFNTNRSPIQQTDRQRSILLPTPGVSSPRVSNQFVLRTNVPKNQAQESPPGSYTYDEYLSENHGPMQPSPSGNNKNNTTDADVTTFSEPLPRPHLSSSSSKLQQASESVADWMNQDPTARFPVQRPAVQVAGDLVANPRPLSGPLTSIFHKQIPTAEVAGHLSPRPLKEVMQPKDDAVREEVEDLDYMKTLRKTVASDKERERLMLEWLLTKYT